MVVLGAEIPAELLARVQAWLHRDVGCLIGRVEYAKDRFAIGAVNSRAELIELRALFGEALATGEVLSCLVLLEPGNAALPGLPISELVRYLDDKYFAGTEEAGARRVEMAEAVTYNLSYHLRCPVTGAETAFGDFDQVAFYPQAVDKGDPLYDPSMYAPFVCVNITSDAYGFAMIAEDRRARGARSDRPFHSLDKAERHEIYDAALREFQKLAERTIENYGRATDPAVLTPICLTDGATHYIAQHDESAFVETMKRPFRSEMPCLYVPRIIAQWELHFELGIQPDMSAIYSPAVPELNS
ncbi:hypothetical protein P3T29_003042 [Kitasatospora sp. MAP5-34]|nr:hypothetical protein [Kitasatospora sp. MAP5-34]